MIIVKSKKIVKTNDRTKKENDSTIARAIKNLIQFETLLTLALMRSEIMKVNAALWVLEDELWLAHRHHGKLKL